MHVRPPTCSLLHAYALVARMQGRIILINHARSLRLGFFVIIRNLTGILSGSLTLTQVVVNIDLMDGSPALANRRGWV